jgi:hypothetical protein
VRQQDAPWKDVVSVYSHTFKNLKNKQKTISAITQRNKVLRKKILHLLSKAQILKIKKILFSTVLLLEFSSYLVTSN